MSFFMSADYSLSTKVMEIIYFIIGLLCIYCGVKNLKDKENPEPVGTFIFWAVLGVVLALGRWLPSLVSGILVVVMCIPAILKKVKKGAVSAATKAETEATIVVYAIGMMLFTMIMGNAYAAITVMTVGIGYPFVLAHGANPVVIGMLALTCGFCGTLCTPMAANFNTVPVALLDMKKPMGVIKNQVPVAIIMMVVQIVMMILLK